MCLFAVTFAVIKNHHAALLLRGVAFLLDENTLIKNVSFITIFLAPIIDFGVLFMPKRLYIDHYITKIAKSLYIAYIYS